MDKNTMSRPTLRAEEYEIDELQIADDVYTIRAELTFSPHTRVVVLDVVEIREDGTEHTLDAEDRERLVSENAELIRDAFESAAEARRERAIEARGGW